MVCSFPQFLLLSALTGEFLFTFLRRSSLVEESLDTHLIFSQGFYPLLLSFRVGAMMIFFYGILITLYWFILLYFLARSHGVILNAFGNYFMRLQYWQLLGALPKKPSWNSQRCSSPLLILTKWRKQLNLIFKKR